MRSKIHISQTTADLLIATGKGHWVTKREDLIEVKGAYKWSCPSSARISVLMFSDIISAGKGHMQAYWCEPHVKSSSTSNTSDSDQVRNLDSAVLDDSLKRLVDWNVEILSRSLARVVGQRQAANQMRADHRDTRIQPEGCPLDEVAEIIELPAFDSATAKVVKSTSEVELPPDIVKELHTYVTAIASMYRGNAFHNFGHASHMAMSVNVSRL